MIKVLSFREFYHSTLDTANKWCYNYGVLRRKGKRESREVIEQLPGKLFRMNNIKIFYPTRTPGLEE